MPASLDLVKYFSNSLNLRFTQSVFRQQLGLAKSLLNTFSYEECVKVIDYLKKYGYKKPVTSLAFLPYLMNEILTEISRIEARKKMLEVSTDYGKINEVCENDNNNKMLENTFVKKGTVQF